MSYERRVYQLVDNKEPILRLSLKNWQKSSVVKEL